MKAMNREALEGRYEELLGRYFEGEDEKTLFEASEFGKELVVSRIGPDIFADLHSRSLKKILKDKDAFTVERKIVAANDVFLNGLMAYSLNFYGIVETIEAEKKKLEEANNNLLKAIEETRRLNEELELKVMERTGQLEESMERVRAIAATAADAIICLKAPDTIYFWNRKAAEMFGYAEKDVIGKDLHDIIVPERYRGKARDGLKPFFETGTGPAVGKAIEIEGLRIDGTEFPVELSISAMNIRGEWHSTGIIRDITERKKAEADLMEQLDELKRFEKASVGRELRMQTIKEENERLKKKISELEDKFLHP